MGSSLNQSRENNGKTINQSLQTSRETEERPKITLKIGTHGSKVYNSLSAVLFFET